MFLMHSKSNHVTIIRLPLLLSLLSAMTALSVSEVKANNKGIPRIVVNILIDQLRADYLNAFTPLYGNDGFLHLLKEGRIYPQAEYPNYRPDRASAAATLVTGTTPYNHGIIGLKWLDRETLRPVNCIDNNQYVGIKTTSRFAPTFLGVSTIGDELKVATEGKSIIYSISPYCDASILCAGHAADGAFWIDDQTGLWCSSSFYLNDLPAWVSVLNTDGISKRIKSLKWQPTNDFVGNFSYFLSGGMKAPFSHKFKGEDSYISYKTSGLVNEEILRAVKQCFKGTMIGTDDITDFLSVTFYAGNLNHKTVNEMPMELQDTYVRLDNVLTQLLNTVESKVGKENALFVITSTGYTDEDTTDLAKYRIPTGTFDIERAAALLNMYLVAIYGQGNFIEASLGTQLYLNHKLIEQKQINLGELLERTQDFLLQMSGIKDVYTSSRLLQGAWTPGINRIRNSYNPRYSGDVLIEVASGWHCINETMHEDQLIRDSYISFPVIFYGNGISSQTINTPITVDYIAPTISKAIRIRAPNACSTSPLF